MKLRRRDRNLERGGIDRQKDRFLEIRRDIETDNPLLLGKHETGGKKIFKHAPGSEH